MVTEYKYSKEKIIEGPWFCMPNEELFGTEKGGRGENGISTQLSIDPLIKRQNVLHPEILNTA